MNSREFDASTVVTVRLLGSMIQWVVIDKADENRFGMDGVQFKMSEKIQNVNTIYFSYAFKFLL